MNTYVAPALVEYGNAKQLIKGDCGWGTENASFDKTGYYEYSTWKCNAAIKDCYSTTICASSNPGDGCKGDDKNC